MMGASYSTKKALKESKVKSVDEVIEEIKQMLLRRKEYNDFIIRAKEAKEKVK